MNFRTGNLYHVYNRGNNRQPIFFNPGNYDYFLDKVQRYLAPNCRLLAYALMPNHFHFLLEADERSEKLAPVAGIPRSALSEGIRMLLSSYSKGVNKQQGFTGNLIQQKTKAKLVFDSADTSAKMWYALACFHYIHQNPYRAKLAGKMEDWPYTSFPEYAWLCPQKICDLDRAAFLLELNKATFVQESYAAIPDEYLQHIW